MQPPPSLLVLAFLDDTTLELHPSCEAACAEYEGVDVEAGAVRFYDAHGSALEPRFVMPNKTSRVLGMKWVRSGTYELVPSTASEQHSFVTALRETVALGPNTWFENLGELKAWLSSRGVAVEA